MSEMSVLLWEGGGGTVTGLENAATIWGIMARSITLRLPHVRGTGPAREVKPSFFFVSLPWARTCLHRLVKANWYALLGERKSTSFYPEKMRIRILVWNEIQCGGSNNIFGLKKTLLRKVVHVFVWQLLLFLKWFLIVTPPNLTQATPNFLLKSFFTSGQSIGQL